MRPVLLALPLLLAACGDRVGHPDCDLSFKGIPDWPMSADDATFRLQHKLAMIYGETPSGSIAIWWGTEQRGTMLLGPRHTEMAALIAKDRGTLPDGSPPEITSVQARVVAGSTGTEVAYTSGGKRARLLYLPGPDRSYILEAVTTQASGSPELDKAFDAILSTVRFRKVGTLTKILGPAGTFLVLILVGWHRIRQQTRSRDAISTV
jgi:hypothetical protein